MQDIGVTGSIDGIDVSGLQGTIDWNAVKTGGKDFAYIRGASVAARPGSDEDVTGTKSGTTYTTSNPHVLGNSEIVLRANTLQVRDTDYTINYSTGAITFNSDPGGDTILVSYRWLFADTAAATNVTNAITAGVPVGLYTFARPNSVLADAVHQADFFQEVLETAFGSGQYGDIFPTIDYEVYSDTIRKNIGTGDNATTDFALTPDRTGGTLTGLRVYLDGVLQTSGWSYNSGDQEVEFTIAPGTDVSIDVTYDDAEGMEITDSLAWVDAMRDRFVDRTGRVPMVYTPLFQIQSAVHNNYNHPTPGNPIADMPLWIAAWTRFGNSNPLPDAGGWTFWEAWQHSDDGKVTGITDTLTGAAANPATGDGSNTVFTTAGRAPVVRDAAVYVNSVLQTETTDYIFNYDAGICTFQPGSIPGAGIAVDFDFSYEATDLDYGVTHIDYLKPPTPPVLTEVGRGADSVSIEWTASGVDILDYEIWVDGSKIVTTPSPLLATEYQLEDSVSDGFEHEIQIKARDKFETGDSNFLTVQVTKSPTVKYKTVNYYMVLPGAEEE